MPGRGPAVCEVPGVVKDKFCETIAALIDKGKTCVEIAVFSEFQNNVSIEHARPRVYGLCGALG